MVNRSEPAVMYFHPWELDPAQPRLASTLGPKFYHYRGLSRTEGRLRGLLSCFSFGALRELAAVPALVYTVGTSESRATFVRLGCT